MKEDLGFGCVCTGARNCLSMLALERKNAREGERGDRGCLEIDVLDLLLPCL